MEAAPERRSADEIDPPRRAWTWVDLLALGTASVLVLLSCSYVTDELTYDEATYLTLARRINESALPLIRRFDDIHRFYLFQNSPPLTLYLAAVTQHWFPGDEVPSRLAHIALFLTPTYFCTWWIARGRFGPAAGLASVLALAGSGAYLASSHRVQLDVPLGLLAVMTVVAFDRALSRSSARRWDVIAAVLLVLAVWTKYQAICIAAGIASGSAWIRWTAGRSANASLRRPLILQVVGGAIGVGLLLAYNLSFGESAATQETLDFNAARMSIGDLDWIAWVRGMFEVATKSSEHLGAVLILASFAAASIQTRHRNLLALLLGYVTASLAFNLIFFRLPGAGSYYLNSAVPAMAILVGATADGAIRVLGQTAAHTVMAAAAAIQFVSVPPPLYLPPYSNDPKQAALYIRSRSAPDDGILATTFAPEFYTGNPVGIITYAGRRVLLEALSEPGRNNIAWIIIPPGPLAGTEGFEEEWDRGLQQHFTLTDADLPGWRIYRRAEVPVQ